MIGTMFTEEEIDYINIIKKDTKNCDFEKGCPKCGGRIGIAVNSEGKAYWDCLENRTRNPQNPHNHSIKQSMDFSYFKNKKHE